jgi:hypothetical protein
MNDDFELLCGLNGIEYETEDDGGFSVYIRGELFASGGDIDDLQSTMEAALASVEEEEN